MNKRHFLASLFAPLFLRKATALPELHSVQAIPDGTALKLAIAQRAELRRIMAEIQPIVPMDPRGITLVENMHENPRSFFDVCNIQTGRDFLNGR